jgi:spore coat protein H
VRDGVRVTLLLLLVCALWARSSHGQTQDDFFSNDRVHDIRLTLSLRDWQALRARADLNTYYPADLRWQGVTVRNIGIRSRGFGTRNGIKPGLRLDFNRYLANQEFLGLKAVVLDNSYTDASSLREPVAMTLFARMGIPAPRETHARLFVNEQYAGAYVIVESVDRTFVSRVFGAEEAAVERGGYLFEYRWTRPYGFEYLGPSLESYAELFKAETRETDSMTSLYRPLEALVRAIAESPPDRVAADVGRMLDLPAFVRFLAVQNVVAEIDGFVGSWGTNHFYLYRFRDGRPAQLIPWDADHAFWAADLPTDYNLDTNVLTRRVLEVPALRRLYLDALVECARLAAEPDPNDGRGWLEREVDRQAGLIAATVQADPAYPFSVEAFEADVAMVRHVARTRPALVVCEAMRADDPPFGIDLRPCAMENGTGGLAGDNLAR